MPRIPLKQLGQSGATEAQVAFWNASAGKWEPRLKNNLSASADPTANDDSDDGYEVGSLWINTSTDEAFQCTDATVASAVWRQISISTSNPGPYLFEINPANLFRSGNKGASEAGGFSVSEFSKNVSEYGVFSLRWRRDPANTVKLYVTFALVADAGVGDTVRIYARTKSVAPGENISVVSFSASQAQDVSVSSGLAGATYEAILTLTPADYSKGDQVAINVGRDGSHANDDYNKAIVLTTIQGEII